MSDQSSTSVALIEAAYQVGVETGLRLAVGDFDAKASKRELALGKAEAMSKGAEIIIANLRDEVEEALSRHPVGGLFKV